MKYLFNILTKQLEAWELYAFITRIEFFPQLGLAHIYVAASHPDLTNNLLNKLWDWVRLPKADVGKFDHRTNQPSWRTYPRGYFNDVTSEIKTAQHGTIEKEAYIVVDVMSYVTAKGLKGDMLIDALKLIDKIEKSSTTWLSRSKTADYNNAVATINQ